MGHEAVGTARAVKNSLNRTAIRIQLQPRCIPPAPTFDLGKLLAFWPAPRAGSWRVCAVCTRLFLLYSPKERSKTQRRTKATAWKLQYPGMLQNWNQPLCFIGPTCVRTLPATPPAARA